MTRSEHGMPTVSNTVIHVIGALVAGGAESFVVALLQSLRARGRDVGLWVLSNRTDDAGMKMAAALQKADVDVAIGPRGRVGAATVLWYARRLLVDVPRAVHLHTPNTELAHYVTSWVAARPRPLLFRTIHNTAMPRTGIARRVYLRNRASGSVACGEAVRSTYATLLGEELLSISNGVTFDTVARNHAASAESRQLLCLDPHARHFVHVGRMSGSSVRSAQKAHDVLIRAWRELDAKGCELHLLGDGNLRPALEGLARGSRSIRFHGVRSDVAAWLQAADCFVMPSRFEGLPIAGIEAIGMGLPCVFSDIAPLRELAPPAALWCPPDDVAALAQCLHTMAERSPAADAVSVERFRERYSIARTAELYTRLYEAHGL